MKNNQKTKAKGFSINPLTQTVDEIASTPMQLEGVFNNQTIFSSSISSLALLAFDSWSGKEEVSIRNFMGHLMVNISAMTFANSGASLAKNQSLIDSILIKGGATFGARLILQLLINYSNSGSFTGWSDAFVTAAVASLGSGLGETVFANMKTNAVANK